MDGSRIRHRDVSAVDPRPGADHASRTDEVAEPALGQRGRGRRGIPAPQEESTIAFVGTLAELRIAKNADCPYPGSSGWSIAFPFSCMRWIEKDMSARISPTIIWVERLASWLIQPAIVLFVLGLVLGRSMDNDTWWHLANGRWMVEHGQILAADPFSYTRAGAVWSHPGYPYEVALYSAFKWLGYRGVDLLAALVISAVFLVEWNALKTGTLRRFLLVGVSILLSISYWSARPNVFTLLFALLFMVVLEGFRLGNRRIIWLLPIAMLLWVNLHGGFPVGFLMVALYAVDFAKQGDRLRTLAAVSVMMALATLANPYGWYVHREIILTAGRAAEQSMIQGGFRLISTPRMGGSF